MSPEAVSFIFFSHVSIGRDLLSLQVDQAGSEAALSVVQSFGGTGAGGGFKMGSMFPAQGRTHDGERSTANAPNRFCCHPPVESLDSRAVSRVLYRLL